ncbi:hypothetical protein [Flavobacterium sp. LHD-85]|uniref:hypothetical protein n=1 Tax=Flavobacterium sp. LHD-85 TaxID=3071410 RepID=UPI0027DFD6F4|nr:hypothetical protein [Flavobacterium sp. LHD-85]MDQ6532134.1 hypothetical protein [Flavobacterium sp. LHD-85]
MEAFSDLSTFAEILTGKGYDGYFQTQGSYAGKLKDSIGEYLESCRKGTESPPKGHLHLTGYLQWTSDDSPRIECSLWVKYLNGKFSLDRMEVARKDRFGKLLKKTELADLSNISAPKAAEAAALVNEDQQQKSENSPKRFKL